MLYWEGDTSSHTELALHPSSVSVHSCDFGHNSYFSFVTMVLSTGTSRFFRNKSRNRKSLDQVVAYKKCYFPSCCLFIPFLSKNGHTKTLGHREIQSLIIKDLSKGALSRLFVHIWPLSLCLIHIFVSLMKSSIIIILKMTRARQ